MNPNILEYHKQTILTGGQNLIHSEQDALDLVGECGADGTHLLLLRGQNLPDEFFDLKTQLAGFILLKFSNYRLKVTAVIPVERIGTGRFYEFAIETRRSSEFRIFTEEQTAIDWLVE
jgi:hypothetical protein